MLGLDGRQLYWAIIAKKTVNLEANICHKGKEDYTSAAVARIRLWIWELGCRRRGCSGQITTKIEKIS